MDLALFILTDDSEHPGLEIVFKSVSNFCLSLTTDLKLKGKADVDRLGHKKIQFSLGGDGWITASGMSIESSGKKFLDTIDDMAIRQAFN